MTRIQTRRLALAGLIAAVYAAATVILPIPSYMGVQFRVAEAMTLLPILFPEAIPGLVVGCFLANLFSPFMLDCIFGTLATLLAALWTRRMPNLWLAAAPPVLCNMLIVGAEIAWFEVQGGGAFWSAYALNALTVGLGEAAACYLLGIPLAKMAAKSLHMEERQVEQHEKSFQRLAVLAAVVSLTAALSGLAVAANFLGLRDIVLPEKGSVNVLDGDGAVVPGETVLRDFISLSGYRDTPESRALAEWQAFLETYDRDGDILRQVGNSPTGFEQDYGLYLVYTQEMADKLEEIVSKYQLKLHRSMEVVLPTVWPLAVGGDFLEKNNTAWSGYIYENGTFRYDGEAGLDGYGTIEYQFSRNVRGSFDDVVLNIGDLTDFQEWGYQTADGTIVTLGLGARNRSLIATDLEDSFVLVNVLAGEEADDTFSSGAIGRAELEALADSFNFSTLSPASVPDLDAVREAGEQYMEELNSQPPETDQG